MAAIIVPSRFAGLKIEDDEYPSSSETQKVKKPTKTNTAKKSEPNKKSKNNTNATKPQGQPAPKKKKNKQNDTSDAQWAIWRQKDEELVDGNFESELQQAILLSKLDFEEKKDVYKQTKKDADVDKKVQEQNAREKGKKQKKKNVMSLDQFNDMMNHGEDHKFNHIYENNSAESIKTPVVQDTEFFERVKNETKDELLKDKIIDRVKNRQTTSEEIVNRVQFTDALEKKDLEIAALKEEVVNLKQELLTVKSRNKKLCNILGQGEMKDKAEVLVENERLRAMQIELNAELAVLHTHLEKERSKNGTDPRTKDKKYSTTKKKNIRFDVSSEAMLSKESSAGTG